MAASNILSPRSSGDGATFSSSPQSRRPRQVSSPWTQIVRGESESVLPSTPGGGVVAPSSPSGSASEQIVIVSSSSDCAAATSSPTAAEDYSASEAQPESPDNGSSNGSGGNATKKQAWGKPSNGNTAIEVVGPVMDTASWPSLSASTKASPKSSSDSLKALSDGPMPALQGTGTASTSNKPVTTNNANTNSTPNHVTPTHQRSMKRSGGGNSANGSILQPLPPPQQGSVEMPPNNSGKPGNTTGDHPLHKEAGQRVGFGPQSHSGNEHQPQRSNSFKRGGGGGQHPRGDSSYHHTYGGGRRDQDRGNQDWHNPHRSFGSRDTHMQPQRVVPRGFVRGPHASPFIPPPPVRPFGNPLVYPEVAPVIYLQGPSPDSLRGAPIVAPMPPPMFYPAPDPQLHTKIVNQIDYYFSNENLIKDTFLRQNMDDQGWVSIKLIAGFKKVMLLTDNLQFILDAVRTSAVVEVQGDKVRKRNDWMRWIMPPVPFSPVSSPQSLARSSHDMLVSQFQNATMDDKTAQNGPSEMFSRTYSGEFSSQLQKSGGEGSGQGTIQAGFEGAALAAGTSSK